MSFVAHLVAVLYNSKISNTTRDVFIL